MAVVHGDLHHAYSLDFVKKAVEEGDDINKYHYNNGLTPLGSAIGHICFDIFKYLIRKGADVNKPVRLNDQHKTPLWFATLHIKKTETRLQFLDLLLKHGAKKTLYNGNSLLTYAIKKNAFEFFDFLIKNGNDVNEVDERGYTPLLRAVEECEIEMIQTLLEHGAEFSIQTAFMQAIALEQLAISKLLLERGADVNFQSVTGFTPLIKATETESLPMVELLIEKGADVNLQSATGFTPLTKAAQSESLPIVELLIKNGADVNLLDSEGNSPLIYSVRFVQLDFIQLLVKNGASIHQTDNHGNSPITEALNTKYWPIITFLIENGADWTVRDKDGFSLLTLAVQEKNFEMLKFLLDRKVNVNEPDNNQKTALLLATETRNPRFIKMLIEHGASVDDVIEDIERLASNDDCWKKLFLELQAEKRIIEHSIMFTTEGNL